MVRMTPERWAQVGRLYHAALARNDDTRTAFLAEACADDEALRREVESLLAQASVAPGFLSTPAIAQAGAILSDDSSLIGRQLGPYAIRSRLGTGGMGEVYLAEDTRLRRLVALKALHDEGAATPEGRERLLHEARAVAALNHPHIAAIYDILDSTDDAGAPPHIVMEYVEGETLSGRLKRGPASVDDALRFGAEVADALAAAHRQGIIHRDLKPANLVLTPDGHVKVLDFGLARMVAPESADTTGLPIERTLQTRADHHVAGTPGYMSPEQALGRTIDTSTDVFSLGVVLFEMLAGRRPFPGDDFLSAALAMITTPTPRLIDVAPNVAPAIDALVTRMLAKEPRDRPSAKDVVAEIKGLSRPGGLDAVAPAVRRRPRWLEYAVGAAGIAMILAAGATWWRTSHGPVRSVRPAIAVLPLVNLSGDPTKDYLGIGIAETLTTSLGRLSSVAVVSRAAMQESGALKTTDAAKIARDLGATLLVQGSLQQSGDRLRVNATLGAPDGRVLWSGDSEASLSELFLLENRLAGSLIDALQVTVSNKERARLVRPPTGNREALDAYWQGIALLDRPDDLSLDRAIGSLQRAIGLDAMFSLAHAGLGEAYRRKAVRVNDPALMASAVSEVSEALRIDPDQPEVRLSLASVYRSTGRNGAAVEQLRQALANQPSNGDAHRQLGDVLASEGQPDEALAELQRAVVLRPQYWRNYQSLGMFYLGTGKTHDAVAAFTRLIELKPDDAVPYQQLGAAYQILGDRSRARENYERSIKVNPNPGSYANLGTIHYAEGHFEEAVRSYEKAIQLAPNRALYRRNLGDANLKLGRKVEAAAAYEKAVQLGEAALARNPSDATTMSQLGVYEAKTGKRQVAEGHANGAIAINPTSSDVLYRRAVVLALNGDANGAVKQLSEAISRGYSKQLALEDDDLAALRSLPSFRSLVASPK